MPDILIPDPVQFPPAPVIAVTGHRPKSMGWTYDLSADCWQALRSRFRQILVERRCTDAWTGMALGVDTVFASAVISLKDEGHPVRLHCAVPFRGQESRWRPDSVAAYRAILSRADETVVVSEGGYSAAKMEDRDRFMVDRCDLLLAVWNGSESGTGRCVRYARRTGKGIELLDPERIAARCGTV